jgi:hypothetical protein
MADDTISLASALQHTESLRQEIRHSKTRTLAALLISTFLAYNWLSVFGRFEPFGGLMLAAPVLSNTGAWLVWVVLSVVRGELALGPARRMSIEDLDTNSIIEQYQATQFVHRAQSTRARAVELLLALQFILMGVYAAFLLLVNK